MRLPTLKPCIRPHCDALVPTRHRPKMCDDCRRTYWRGVQAERMRVARSLRKPLVGDLTAEQIEARLAINDAEIRRTRPFTVELGWSSPLARLR